MVALTTAAYGFDVLDLHYWMTHQVLIEHIGLNDPIARSTSECQTGSTGRRMLSDFR